MHAYNGEGMNAHSFVWPGCIKRPFMHIDVYVFVLVVRDCVINAYIKSKIESPEQHVC
jgi:hypothetical protein